LSRKIDWPSVKAATRTAGALMAGNAFVAHLIMDNENWLKLGLLFFFGVAAIISASIEKKE
jgi:hypothetical protein